jgi:hypothetical protein
MVVATQDERSHILFMVIIAVKESDSPLHLILHFEDYTEVPDSFKGKIYYEDSILLFLKTMPL